MKLAQSVRLAAWFLIGLNLVMAFGSIWIFVRMTPAIEFIIDRNVTSIQTCEEMLAALAMVRENRADRKTVADSPEDTFREALQRAQQNITEADEPIIIKAINQRYRKAFAGDAAALTGTVDAILSLGAANRAAMVAADKKARQFGNAGAWGIVFMATVVFLIGMLFIRSLKKNLLHPLEEIHSVTATFRQGDTMRRCTGTGLPKEIHQIYRELNDLLDKGTQQNFPGQQQEQPPH